MSVLQVIDAFERVVKRVEQRGAFYTDEGRIRRITMLVSWAHALGRYGVADFSRFFQRDLAQHPDAADDAMGEVFDDLGVNTIEELTQLCK